MNESISTVLAISELAKLSMTAYLAYLQQVGLTADQIESTFQAAKKAMLDRDPAKIPSA